MLDKKIKLLKRIVETPSPSGFEFNLAKLIQKELLNSLSRTKINIDFHRQIKIKFPHSYHNIIHYRYDKLGNPHFEPVAIILGKSLEKKIEIF